MEEAYRAFDVHSMTVLPFVSRIAASVIFAQAQVAETPPAPASVPASVPAAASKAVSPPDPAKEPPPSGMVWIPGGEFSMGSIDPLARSDESPVHRVRVDGFWMDATEVTNAEFRQFVEATGYKTIAERPIEWDELKKQVAPGTPKPPDEMLVPGSLVFHQTEGAVEVGVGRPARAGGIPKAPAVRSKGRTTTLSCTSPSTTRSPTASGPGSVCPPKPNGSLLRAAGLTGV